MDSTTYKNIYKCVQNKHSIVLNILFFIHLYVGIFTYYLPHIYKISTENAQGLQVPLTLKIHLREAPKNQRSLCLLDKLKHLRQIKCLSNNLNMGRTRREKIGRKTYPHICRNLARNKRMRKCRKKELFSITKIPLPSKDVIEKPPDQYLYTSIICFSSKPRHHKICPRKDFFLKKYHLGKLSTV